jgi:uncharacterized protein YndB with AHSA1/START domain
MAQKTRPNPMNDLEMTRLFRAPVAAFWRCWTEPALLAKWWAPAPAVTTDVVIAPVPGGRFFTGVLMPDGNQIAHECCILRVEPLSCLVLTDVLEQDFRPAAAPAFGYTATVRFGPESGGTRFTMRFAHATQRGKALHEEMGFHEAWSLSSSQLGGLAETLGG